MDLAIICTIIMVLSIIVAVKLQAKEEEKRREKEKLQKEIQLKEQIEQQKRQAKLNAQRQKEDELKWCKDTVRICSHKLQKMVYKNELQNQINQATTMIKILETNPIEHNRHTCHKYIDLLSQTDNILQEINKITTSLTSIQQEYDKLTQLIKVETSDIKIKSMERTKRKLIRDYNKLDNDKINWIKEYNKLAEELDIKKFYDIINVLKERKLKL